ncbi:MAG: MBL fold metallo-hydrolase [Bacteroidia bacterium]|nr:MBL fold metallo-hydrolase [Bacteroidia bacterium]
MLHTIDLHFHLDHAIAAFVVETHDGLVLIESGPHSVFPYLEKGLADLGFSIADVKHLLLTHIHFDHAGAAWALAQAGAQVYVHPRGYKHLLDPSRLYGSAKRIYGDFMESLWGDMQPIAEQQLTSVEHGSSFTFGGKTFTAWHTPGHASHHIAWQWGDQVFAGDVAGVSIDGGPVVPPCPPPDIDIEAWNDSLDLLVNLKPSVLHLTHFGAITEVETHISQLRQMLTGWSQWIFPHWEAGRDMNIVTPEFQTYASDQLRDAGLGAAAIDRYQAANPAWMSVAGLYRYWTKKSEE